jgi:hypothetical protein
MMANKIKEQTMEDQKLIVSEILNDGVYKQISEGLGITFEEINASEIFHEIEEHIVSKFQELAEELKNR